MQVTAFDLCKLEGHPGPSRNPRLSHLCERCARPLASDEMERDIEQESRWIAEAAEYAQYVQNAEGIAASLGQYRQLRMGDGPWRNVSQRDWITEAEEEFVDGSAYITAALQELGEDRNDEDHAKCQMLLKMALSASITAYAALNEYRRTDA